MVMGVGDYLIIALIGPDHFKVQLINVVAIGRPYKLDG